MAKPFLVLLPLLAWLQVSAARKHASTHYEPGTSSTGAESDVPIGASYNPNTRTFRLDSAHTTYTFRLAAGNSLVEHIYWGENLGYTGENENFGNFINAGWAVSDVNDKSWVQMEWNDFGTGELRRPSFQVLNPYDGSTLTPLEYVSHTIHAGKPEVAPELPSAYVDSAADASSLSLLLRDNVSGLEVTLWYTVFHKLDVITRRAIFRNSRTDANARNLTILSAMSATFDLYPGNWHLTHFSGAWGRERQPITNRLTMGTNSVESRRGASSHQQNPFIVLSNGPRHEEHGEHLGLGLIYSGNFLAEVEMGQSSRSRVSIGINPFGFSWNLCPGCQFSTPEVIMARSGNGMGGLSRTLHDLTRKHIMHRGWEKFRRPILVNSWEAMYFDVNYNNVVNKLAIPAQKLGIPLIVIDDGWFSNRWNDQAGLGDWDVNTSKFPGGLEAMSAKLKEMGLELGIWMEPEAIQTQTQVYRNHPDWNLGVDGRPLSFSRNELLMDLLNPDVRDYIYESIAKTIIAGNMTYMKWDFNRVLSEAFSRSRAKVSPLSAFETEHGYILGLYEILRRVRTTFPNLHLESCASGGGRFDYGILAFSDAVWTSDNTDTISRAFVQYGTSFAYPLITMGSHIANSPNHQVGRLSSPGARALVASLGTFGYELDLSSLSRTDWVIKWNKRYESIFAQLVRDGEVWRLADPFDSSIDDRGLRYMAMGVVGRDAVGQVNKAVVVAILTTHHELNWSYPNLRLPFLKDAPADAKFTVSRLMTPCGEWGLGTDEGEWDANLGVITGRVLSGFGVPFWFGCDGQAMMIRVERV